MLRGDLRWVDFGEALDAETGFKRPAVVVSNNGVNAAVARRGRGAVTVVSMTSRVGSVHGFEVLLPSVDTGLPQSSKAQVHLVRAVSLSRIGPRIGTVPPHLMREIDDALRVHLAL